MNTVPTPPARPRHHPLLLIAAIAVILFCAVGTAAIMGWLPTSSGNRNQLSDADRAALAANLPQPAATTASTAPTVPAQTAAPAAPVPGYAPITAADGSQAYAAAAPAAPATAYGASGSQGSTGAGSDPMYAPVPAAAPAPAPATASRAADDSRWCASCGNVESIHTIQTRARGSGVGAGAGAILGGLLGNQLGSGHGRQLATVAGAVGGAVVGNQVEGNMNANTSYEIRVRLDDGTLRTFHQHSVPRWHTGERVRIVKGALHTA